MTKFRIRWTFLVLEPILEQEDQSPWPQKVWPVHRRSLSLVRRLRLVFRFRPCLYPWVLQAFLQQLRQQEVVRQRIPEGDKNLRL